MSLLITHFDTLEISQIGPMKSKFLVLHPDPRNLDSIIQKANLQHAKNGPFSAIILLGTSLPAEAPTTKPDAPTYFFGKSDQEGIFVDVELNYTCVTTRNAFLKLESGVTLAFLNDTITQETTAEPAAKADVLFSYNWPYCIAADQRLTLVGDEKVDSVVKEIQPRYHFAAGSEAGKLYEHKMVAWTSKRSYRFISLAREGTGNKWFFAFGIDTGDDEATMPEVNPFLDISAKRTRESDTEHETHTMKLPRLEPRPIKVVAPSECFFCLSNPKLESHMIVSIGKSAYLTIAKGPLTRPTKKLDFSGHAIIVPIEHSPTLSKSVELKVEIEKYKQSLADAFSSQGFDVVFYEISRPQNVHFHIQAVPVLKGLIEQNFERALDEKTQINNNNFEHNSKLDFKKYVASDEERLKLTDSGSYIQFTTYSGSGKHYFVTSLEEEKPIDLQFPRRVLAFLLRLQKRVSWDRCKQTTSQETSECQKFKGFYETFDFTKE